MRVAERMHKLARFKPRNLRHHHGQKRIRGNIERHAEKHVAAALIEHAGKPVVCRIKLKHHMAGRQPHFGDFADVPGRNDHPPVVGIAFQRFNHRCQLVYALVVPVAPLRAVYRPEIAVFVRPFVPDTHAVFLKPADVGIAFDKP